MLLLEYSTDGPITGCGILELMQLVVRKGSETLVQEVGWAIALQVFHMRSVKSTG